MLLGSAAQDRRLLKNVAMPMNPAANQPHCKGVLPSTVKLPPSGAAPSLLLA